ncbi:MAG: hypothetical protein IKX70_03225 [Treponema sp.]|nr:hypothetical protein [Treponema sp.]
MKKLLFVLVMIVTVMAIVSCKDPVIQNVVVYEDKSPYEYKLPNSNINLNDYRYVGDYIFSDAMDFTQWKYTNGTMYSQYGYFMVFEKLSRVKFNGDDGGCFTRYGNIHDGLSMFAVEKGTRYKVFLKKTFIDNFSISEEDADKFVTILEIPLVDSFDGSTMKIQYSKKYDYFLTAGSELYYSTYYRNYMDIQ